MLAHNITVCNAQAHCHACGILHLGPHFLLRIVTLNLLYLP